jgi:hypothetical protein
LVLDAETRAGLGDTGQKAALKREISSAAAGWIDILEPLVQLPVPTL